MHDALNGRAAQNYEEYTAEQKADIQENIHQFCRGELSELPVCMHGSLFVRIHACMFGCLLDLYSTSNSRKF